MISRRLGGRDGGPGLTLGSSVCSSSWPASNGREAGNELPEPVLLFQGYILHQGLSGPPAGKLVLTSADSVGTHLQTKTPDPQSAPADTWSWKGRACVLGVWSWMVTPSNLRTRHHGLSSPGLLSPLPPQGLRLVLARWGTSLGAGPTLLSPCCA